jgi:hypothetical protein
MPQCTPNNTTIKGKKRIILMSLPGFLNSPAFELTLPLVLLHLQFANNKTWDIKELAHVITRAIDKLLVLFL